MKMLSKIFGRAQDGEADKSQRANASLVTDIVSAADWIAIALGESGYHSNFSVDSLREVDRFFDEHAPNGTPMPDGLLAKDRGSRLFALGGYVGETIRKVSGGEWRADASDPRGEINIELILRDGTIVWPVQRILKRYENGAEDGIYAYGRALIDAVGR